VAYLKANGYHEIRSATANNRWNGISFFPTVFEEHYMLLSQRPYNCNVRQPRKLPEDVLPKTGM
jgi:hypothetical protein